MQQSGHGSAVEPSLGRLQVDQRPLGDDTAVPPSPLSTPGNDGHVQRTTAVARLGDCERQRRTPAAWDSPASSPGSMTALHRRVSKTCWDTLQLALCNALMSWHSH